VKVGHRQTLIRTKKVQQNPLTLRGGFLLGIRQLKPCKIRLVNTRTKQSPFPVLRRLSDGRFHSGQALAHEFRASRASIYNMLSQSESMGLTVHAVRGRGYRLPDPVEWLDGDVVARHLGTRRLPMSIRVSTAVESTNTALMAAALSVLRMAVCWVLNTSNQARAARPALAFGSGGQPDVFVLWSFRERSAIAGGVEPRVGLAIALR